MAVRIEHVLNFSPDRVWEIVGQPDRVDWVPGVKDCIYQDGVRALNMPGAGAIRERILLQNDDTLRLEYSCIESPMPLQAHKASIQLEAKGDGCLFIWETIVDPVSVEPFIEQSMQGALVQLEQILEKE